MGIQVTGFFGFLILVADIWAILNVVQARGSNASKLAWVLVILLLPLLGFLIWLVFGPRGKGG